MFRFISIALGFLWIFNTAFAQDSGTDFWKVANISEGRALNVRSGPSVDFTVLGALPYNTVKIKNNGCFPDFTSEEWQRFTSLERSLATDLIWCRVSHEGIEGWASFRYLEPY